MGNSVSSAGDVNGDGFDDLIVGSSMDSGAIGAAYVLFGKEGGYSGEVNVTDLDGNDGFAISGVNKYDLLGYSVSSAGDINGDAFDDIIVGASTTETGKSYVVFGKENGYTAQFSVSDLITGTGSAGFVINGITKDMPDEYFGHSVSSAGDVNGDGYDDLIIGASATDPDTASTDGEAYILFGKASGYTASIDLANLTNGTGEEGVLISGLNIHNNNPENSLDYASQTVSSAGDINGDGFDDVVVGANWADNTAGESYVLFGGTHFSNQVTDLGTMADDTLTGSVDADVLIGAQGDDTLFSHGGVDTIYGGQGDDTVDVINTDFLKVDGGSGVDTLIWNSDQELDLGALSHNQIENIEIIDLSANQGSLTLDALDLLNLSTTSNTLRVEGDADNQVDLSGTEWINSGVNGDYDVYTNDAATLEIKNTITQNLPADDLDPVLIII